MARAEDILHARGHSGSATATHGDLPDERPVHSEPGTKAWNTGRAPADWHAEIRLPGQQP